MRLLLAAVLFCAIHTASVAQEASRAGSGPLVLDREGSFFIGGREIRSDTLSAVAGFPSSGTITVDQMYVRYEIPAGSIAHVSLTLVHGCCLTGKTWETTPDGRMGWAEYFVRKGYPTYVVDQVWRGRSAADLSAMDAVRQGASAGSRLPAVVSAGHEAAWTIFRFGPEYPRPFPGLQFPVEAQQEFWKQMVPDVSYNPPTPNPTVPALSELAHRLGGTVFISHSQSGIYPLQAAMLGSRDIDGIIAIEPSGCPAATGDMTPLKAIPILVLFGDYVDAFPNWSGWLEGCRAFVRAVNAADGHAELMILPEMGIHGNSHMMMQDRNNLEVADILLDWLARRVAHRRKSAIVGPD